MARADPAHRFFLFAHYYHVHSDFGSDLPYEAPQSYRDAFFPGGYRWTRSGDTSLLTQLQRENAATAVDIDVLGRLYDAGVRFTDEEMLGRLLDGLRYLGLDESTLLVVTSDHGEEIFEHGKCSHQQPYEETTRVPLILRGPGIPRGFRIPNLVELADLMPTLLSLLDLPIPDHIQGRDLTPLLRGQTMPERAAHVDGIFGGVPHQWLETPSSLIVERDGRRWSYVNTVRVRKRGEQQLFRVLAAGELYLLDEDPDQQHDVSGRHPEFVEELERQLLSWYAANDAKAQLLGEGEVDAELLSTGEREALRALGYVE